jgi:hypothetical protein
MVVGIISEGLEDQGVIKNILLAVAKSLDLNIQVRPLRPSLQKDLTDLKNPKNPTIGTFQGVKNACLSKNDFKKFFYFEDSLNIVIHLDTAEIDQNNLSFTRPQKVGNPNYSTELRDLVINEINDWLDSEEFQAKSLYAISIEEIEAWVLTIFEQVDTTYMADPKSSLARNLIKKNLISRQLSDKSLFLEEVTMKHNFHKIKNLKIYAEKNESLKAFIIEVEKEFKQIATSQK